MDVRGLAPELELLVAQTPDDPFLLRLPGGWPCSIEGARNALRTWKPRPGRSRTTQPAGSPWPSASSCSASRWFAEHPWSSSQRPVDSAQWWLYRGRIEDTAGQTESAVASFERAVALNPRSREAYFRLGRALETARPRRGGPAPPGRGEPAREALKTVRREHQQLRRAGLPAEPQLFEKLGRFCPEAGLVAEASPGSNSRSSSTLNREVDPLTPPRSAWTRFRSHSPTPSPQRAARHQRVATILQELHPGQVRRSALRRLSRGPAAAGITYYYESGAGDRRLLIADTMGGGVGLIDFDAMAGSIFIWSTDVPLAGQRKESPRTQPPVPQPARRHLPRRDRSSPGSPARVMGWAAPSATTTMMATTTCS